MNKHYLWIFPMIFVMLYSAAFIASTWLSGLEGLLFFGMLGGFAFYINWRADKLEAERIALLDDRLSRVDNFIPEKQSYTYDGIVAFSTELERLVIVTPTEVKDYPFNRIISVGITDDTISVERNSKSSFLLRALFGGMFGGGLGSVVATSNMKKNTEILGSSLALKVTFDSLNDPFQYIVFLSSKRGVSKSSKKYHTAQKDLEYWNGVLDVIIHRRQKEVATTNGIAE